MISLQKRTAGGFAGLPLSIQNTPCFRIDDFSTLDRLHYGTFTPGPPAIGVTATFDG